MFELDESEIGSNGLSIIPKMNFQRLFSQNWRRAWLLAVMAHNLFMGLRMKILRVLRQRKKLKIAKERLLWKNSEQLIFLTVIAVVAYTAAANHLPLIGVSLQRVDQLVGWI